MTTSPVMTVTDELLAELEQQSARDPVGAFPVRYAVISELTTELRRLRAENADLAKDAGRYRHIRADGIPDEAIAMVDSYYGDLELVSPDRLDAAIDTAMATQ